jgi:hypothetical protein
MGKHPVDDVVEVDAVQREIDVLRQRTEDLIAELERRVETRVDGAKRRVERVKEGLSRAREFGDVPAQVRAHPRAAAGVGVGTLALAGLGVWWLLARRAEERRFVRRVQRRAGAYRDLLANPERALEERGPSLKKRLVGAILIALATSMTKRLIMR